MNILLDQNTPRTLLAAEAAGFNVFLACDQNLSHQQNLCERKIASVELTSNNWPMVRPHPVEIARAVNSTVPGSYVRVSCSS
jgi:hypothetical protein